jgi:hypothetical protein
VGSGWFSDVNHGQAQDHMINSRPKNKISKPSNIANKMEFKFDDDDDGIFKSRFKSSNKNMQIDDSINSKAELTYSNPFVQNNLNSKKNSAKTKKDKMSHLNVVNKGDEITSNITSNLNEEIVENQKTTTVQTNLKINHEGKKNKAKL